jgi:hypothetical protein
MDVVGFETLMPQFSPTWGPCATCQKLLRPTTDTNCGGSNLELFIHCQSLN